MIDAPLLQATPFPMQQKQFMNLCFHLLRKWQLIHFGMPFFVMILGLNKRTAWVGLVALLVLAGGIYIQLRIRSLACEITDQSFQTIIQRRKRPFVIGCLTVSLELVAIFLSLAVLAVVVFETVSETSVRVLILALILVVVVLAIRNQVRFSFIIPFWVGVLLQGGSSIPESVLDGNTVGTSISFNVTDTCPALRMMEDTPLYWSVSKGFGGPLFVILLIAYALQLACLRVIMGNYAKEEETAPVTKLATKLGKMSVILDLPSSVSFFEDVARRSQTSTEVEDQMQSEKFKTKGIYENVLQGWFTVLVITTQWGHVSYLQSILTSLAFMMGTLTIWTSARGFCRWQLSSGRKDDIFFMLLHVCPACMLSGGSLVRFIMICHCGADHVFSLTTGECVPILDCEVPANIRAMQFRSFAEFCAFVFLLAVCAVFRLRSYRSWQADASS